MYRLAEDDFARRAPRAIPDLRNPDSPQHGFLTGDCKTLAPLAQRQRRAASKPSCPTAHSRKGSRAQLSAGERADTLSEDPRPVARRRPGALLSLFLFSRGRPMMNCRGGWANPRNVNNAWRRLARSGFQP